MWRTIERLSFKFETIIPNGDLDNTHGNFIESESGWSESYYANPVIAYHFGEIGYSLDGLYCVFTFNIQNLNDELLTRIIEFS